jgi:3-dehydroquinate synthase
MSTVTINLGTRSYDVHVEPGILSQIGALARDANLGKHAAVITDANVSLHYSEKVLGALREAGLTVTCHLIPPGEASKSMDHAAHLCRSLIEHHHDRKSFVIALGGGVVGDLAGFVAAIFYRGIPIIQIPTTIVSQVDSSVGGKTGVNTPEGKNLLGAFHQPSLVVIDPDTLTTLPNRVYREGYAEVIKHAAIRDAAMLDTLEALDPANQTPDPALLAANIAIKARIVEEDEHETSGTRALLNFGHTIGHAIEASVPYGQLLHGEAISLGIRAALFLSEKLTDLDPAHSKRLLDLLQHFDLPLVLGDEIETESILSHMSRDKKFCAGERNFVLLERNGHAVTNSKATDALINQAIAHIRTPV